MIKSISWRTLAIVVLSLVLASVAWDSVVLYPVKLFSTLCHESGHAVMALISGGHVQQIVIRPDGSGVTFTQGGIRFLTVSGGYLGSAFFGALLLWCGSRPWLGTVIHRVVALVLGVGLVLFVREPFTLLYSLVLAGFFWHVMERLSPQRRRDVLMCLGTVTGLLAVVDLRDMLGWGLNGAGHGQNAVSDAQQMQQMTGLPALVWSLLWTVGAAALMGLALWHGVDRTEHPDPVAQPHPTRAS